MKLAFAAIFLLAGTTAINLPGQEKVSLEITERVSNRQARYGKGDIPLLLIRPTENNKKTYTYRTTHNHRPPMNLAQTKPEEPTGAFSETSYILKTNDDSLSFTELLPKLGLSTSTFGLPSVQNVENSGSQSRPKNAHPQSSSSSSSILSSTIGNGPVYKVASDAFKTNSGGGGGYNSVSSHAVNHPQKVTVKSQLYTTINGDAFADQGSGKPSFSSSSRHKQHYRQQPQQQQQPHYHFQSHSSPSFSHGSSSSIGNSPPRVIEEIVVGKPTGDHRPSLPTQHLELGSSSEYSQDESTSPFDHHQYQFETEHQPQDHLYSHHEEVREEAAPPSTDHSDVIHSSQSDHKFGHITTNYYIPHTIQSESEYQQKPFLPSPQVEYFVPKDAHEPADHTRNSFRNHYVPSEEAQQQQQQEEQQHEHHSESAETQSYFLPKFNPTFKAPAVVPAPSVTHGHHKVVYQENPTFTSYFKFGTNVEESNKVETRPHLFPRTESGMSFGSQFKPNSQSSFSAHPTPVETPEEKPTASKTYYTIKEEPLDYNPYKSAPVALLRPQYANHDSTNYDQVHQDFVSKYQGSSGSSIHREFNTKVEAETFVKNTFLGGSSSSPAIEKRPMKFKFLPTAPPTVPAFKSENVQSYPDPHYVYEELPMDQGRPIVEPTSTSNRYALPDAPNFDNAHLDLGLNQGQDASEQPARKSFVRPPMQLKETIASKKTPSDTASPIQTSAATATNKNEETPTTAPSTVEDNQQATNPQSSRINQNNNNNHFGGSSQHSSPNHPPPHSQKMPPQQFQLRPQQRRRPAPANKNNLPKKSAAKDQSPPVVEPLSEKTSDTKQGNDEKKKRLNPRQKVISCERQCIRNNLSQEYDPVCGNDGKTYSNKGKLRCTQKCGQSELVVDHLGSCSPTRR